MKHGFGLGLAAATLLLALPTCVLADTCDSLAAQARATGDPAQMQQIWPQVRDCDAVLGEWLGRRIAAHLYNQAIAGGAPDEQLLTASLTYGRVWQSLAALADLAFARHDFATAAGRYQDALVEIASADRTPTPPAAEIIIGLRRKAEESALLADRYVPTARGRDGSNAGLAAISIRGVSITAVALPVQFVFGTSDLTDQGRRAAQDMADLLRNERPAPAGVTLVGHTDAQGGDDYNLRLSQARADAVAALLRAHGVTVPITAVGHGETEPYPLDDPGQFSPAQVDQMNRRVELRRQ